MGSKDNLMTFRTSDENVKYLKDLAESDERSVSFVLHKMVDALRARGVKKVSKI